MQKAGITEPQAEAIVAIIGDNSEELVTKSDCEYFKETVKSEFKSLRTDIENLRQETKADNEILKDLIKIYSESTGKEKNWLRWAVGLNTAKLILLLGYVLSQ